MSGTATVEPGGAIALIQKEGTNQILLGKDGVQVYEQKGPHENEIIEAANLRLNNRNRREAVTANLAARLRPLHNFDIRVPLVEPQGAAWKTKARKLLPGKAFTAPKGGREEGESTKETILRELFEEIGNFDFSRIESTGKIAGSTPPQEIFHIIVTPGEAAEIEAKVAKRNSAKIGEMFEIGFRNPRGLGVKLNPITFQAVQQVFPPTQRAPGLAFTKKRKASRRNRRKANTRRRR